MFYRFANVGIGLIGKKYRTGAVVLEAIIALPILMISVIAIVELGLLSTNQAIVQAASVAGADAAVQIGCTLPESGDVPAEIIQAVDAALDCQGITASCIRVEHTNGAAGPYVLESGSGASTPLAPPPTDAEYVCVSVCVENTELAPDMLSTFCFSLAGSMTQYTTCRCIEDCEECPSTIQRFEAETSDVQTTTGGPDPNGWIVWSNGEAFVRTDIEKAGNYRFCSRAWGQRGGPPGGPDIPRAELRVDGVTLLAVDVLPQSFATAEVYCVDVFLTPGSHQIEIGFVNDYYAPPVDRNLFVDWLQLEGPL